MSAIEAAAKIKHKLWLRGYSLADIERIHGLPRCIAGITLRKPHKKGEEAIAAALGVAPHELWPERYSRTGQRLSPQPRENRTAFPNFRQRRKRAGQLTEEN